MKRIKLNGVTPVVDAEAPTETTSQIVNLSPKEMHEIYSKPQTRLCKMVFKGAACRQKHQAKEMRRRGLTGKWAGMGAALGVKHD